MTTQQRRNLIAGLWVALVLYWLAAAMIAAGQWAIRHFIWLAPVILIGAALILLSDAMPHGDCVAQAKLIACPR